MTCLLSAMVLSRVHACLRRQKTRLLIVTGGHGFEKEPFFKMFEDNTEIILPRQPIPGRSASAYDRDDLFNYDVVVLYGYLPKEITERTEKAKFLSLFDKGIGLDRPAPCFGVLSEFAGI